ncbi:MAG: tyrosine-type recombinase/integrase [Clostridia bacterium]
MANNPRVRANGQGTVYKLPNGKWRAEVTLGWEKIKDAETGEEKKGRRITKTKSGFKLKRDAVEYLSTLRNTPVAIDMKIQFKDMYDLWSVPHYARLGSKDTENGYKAAYKHCEELYYRTFCELKTKDLQSVIDNCPRERRTKADIKSLLRNMYKYAIENDYCVKNYADYIKLPPKPKSKKDAFTSSEISTLWADYNCGNDFTGYILIMIYTGMRYGEISTIKKGNVHLEERYMIGGIKTEAGIDREIPICEKIYPIVEKVYIAGNKKILEMHEKVFYNSFYVTLERLGIRKLNPHCCRHTFATLMANSGVQPAIITETIGHEDYSTTMQYTHIHIEEKLKAVNGL